MIAKLFWFSFIYFLFHILTIFKIQVLSLFPIFVDSKPFRFFFLKKKKKKEKRNERKKRKNAHVICPNLQCTLGGQTNEKLVKSCVDLCCVARHVLFCCDWLDKGHFGEANTTNYPPENNTQKLLLLFIFHKIMI